MGEKYTYQHPDGKGLGAHHADPADPPLHERLAQPETTRNTMRGALGLISPTEEQQATVDEYLGRSMHDLDMPHGTVTELDSTDEESGVHRLTWTDRHGNPRATSVTPELLAEMFTSQAETSHTVTA